MKKHLVFVVNPHSGTVRNKPLKKYIDQYLDQQQFTYQIIPTKYAQHGITIAFEAAAAGHFAVVAVGGDGSVNDIVQGLLNSETALGIIPKGSGNGLARALKIPLNYKGAIEKINQQLLQKMDVGKANDYYFVSNAGVGFDAAIMHKFEGNKKRGLLEYAKVILKVLQRPFAQPIHVTTGDASFHENVFMVTVANGSQYGYNFRIIKEASVFDGLFDVVLLKKMPWYAYPSIIWRSNNASLHKSKYALHIKTNKLTLHHSSLQYFQVDGEAKTCKGQVEIELIPQAINVLL